MLRARCPGSKFLALASPELKSDEEILELLYTGVEGLVKFTDRVDEELAQAVKTLMAGGATLSVYEEVHCASSASRVGCVLRRLAVEP